MHKVFDEKGRVLFALLASHRGAFLGVQLELRERPVFDLPLVEFQGMLFGDLAEYTAPPADKIETWRLTDFDKKLLRLRDSFRFEKLGDQICAAGAVFIRETEKEK